MPQNGDVLQVKDIQQFAGIEGEIMNVYYYRCGSLDDAFFLSEVAEIFSTNFADVVLSLVTPLQSNQVSHVRLEVNNLMDYATDFFSYSYDTPILGVTLDGYSAANEALSVQLVRTNRTTRHGSKRFGGISEGYIVNNALAGAGIAAMNTLVANISEPQFIEYAGGETVELIPVILKSPVLTTVAPTVINPVADAAYRGIGSQNTRKQLLA